MKRLRLVDLVVFNVCAVVSLRWLPPAAHAGSGSLFLFLLAAVFFFAPSGFVVARLSERCPEPGGLFAWIHKAFGPRHAFLCSWFYFLSNLFYFPSLVLFAVSTMAFIFGDQGAALAENPHFAIPTTLGVLWLLFLANYLGLSVARSIQTAGLIAIATIFVLLCAFGSIALSEGTQANRLQLFPTANMEAVNLFSIIAFAFVGLELAPILSGEILHPGRNIPRAAVVSGIVCVAFYAAGTAALLILLSADAISPLTGLVQAGAKMQRLVHVPGVSACFAAALTFAVAAQLVTWIAGNTRLPYAIGLAAYLPPVFARLHPRWNTPYASLLVQASVTTLILLMAQLGETVKAAYQIMLDMLVLATFVPFLYIFAAGWHFSARAAAVSGLVVTLLSIGLSLVPPPGVASPLFFELKIIGGFVAVVFAGLGLYKRYEKRNR